MKKPIITTLVCAALLSGCFSTKSKINNKIDRVEHVDDNSIKVIELEELNFDLSEIKVIAKKESDIIQIIDSKGRTKTIKGAESVTIKKEQKQQKSTKEDVQNDIKTKIIDKSKIKESSEKISDWNNIKYIVGFIALIVVVLAACYVIFKFKR